MDGAEVSDDYRLVDLESHFDAKTPNHEHKRADNDRDPEKYDPPEAIPLALLNGEESRDE
jgi:hypothetical protein